MREIDVIGLFSVLGRDPVLCCYTNDAFFGTKGSDSTASGGSALDFFSKICFDFRLKLLFYFKSSSC